MKAICLGVVVVLCACKGDPPARPAVRDAAASPPADAALAVPQMPPPVAADDVRALVDAWLEAQNAGDFARYEALYAARMEGVKRVGPRASRFDRAGWLADRKRMFRHRMTVAARDPRITTFYGSAAVDFVQTFAQGKFRDEGPKRLVVIDEGGALRIAREEMLASALLPSPQGSHGTSGVRPIVTIERVAYVVLDGSAEPSWGAPEATVLVDNEDWKLATRAATALPSDLAAWRGKSVRGFTPAGAPCAATIADLVLLSGGTPPAQTVHAWNGHPSVTTAPALTPAQRASAIFDLGFRPRLVGRLDLAGCTPVVVIDAGAPVFYPPAPDDPAMASAVIAKLRAGADYDDVQQHFETQFGGRGTWLPRPDVRLFAGGDHRYATVGGTAGPGCGDFIASIWALYDVTSGAPVFIASFDAETLVTAALFDSDGDGNLELIATRPDQLNDAGAYLRVSYQRVIPVAAIDFPFLDLHCERPPPDFTP